MKKICFSLIAFFLLSESKSQAPPSWTSAEMYQAIRKLNVLGSVLYVAAHPDDENTRLIGYLSKDRLYRTGYLSVTRGDGGQNLIGEEQGIELGLIRTQELLSARRIDGGEQFFTRAYDFGFSKSPEETFTKWDKEKILSDVVWVVRTFRPDVIITRFPTTGEGGHGHHTASALLANEAFSAAADPGRFPEQLKYVSVWQAKRVLWNTFSFGGTNTTREDQFKFDVGGYNPLLGKSYGEIAAESRSQHKSQGFGVPAGRGEALEYLKATKGDQPVSDLMEGIELGWKKLPGAEFISAKVDGIISVFDFLHPEKSVPGLVQLYKELSAVQASTPQHEYWIVKKRNELADIIQQCSGLFVDATTSDPFIVITDSVKINFSFNNRLGVKATLKQLRVQAGTSFDTSFTLALQKNRNQNFSKTFFVAPGTPQTQPYWLEQAMEEGYFNVSDQKKIGKPDVEPVIKVESLIEIEGQEIRFEKPVKYKFTDPVKGELYQPLVVIPPLQVSPVQNLVITRGNNTFEGGLSITSKKKQVQASFEPAILKSPDSGLSVSYEPQKLKFESINQESPVSYKVKAGKDNEYQFRLKYESATGEQHAVTLGDFHQVKYNHIPYISYFTPASVKNIKLDLATYNKKIGYITGAGDKVPEALEQLGFEVTLLSDKDLSKNGIDKYDAIITGVRAYNTNDWMNKHYNKLMKYVHEGGNLIVQYNTSNQIGPVRSKMGPYPFDITRARITDEQAEVTFLIPEHPVFNFPNKITQDDFKGWVQERSIYHGRDSSGKFEKLLRMNDPGEKPDDGSLMITKYGKGWFTYTGLVFFRELPAGVPGAYRLLANLIALNRKKGF